tara:strand:- start:172 stop:414 length:243 start_codon:yes stop_codon:yes gene_type:complete
VIVWLMQSFDGLGAFASGPSCSIVERPGVGFEMRTPGRLLVVPWGNVAGVQYSPGEEVAVAATTPPVVAVASPPAVKGKR